MLLQIFLTYLILAVPILASEFSADFIGDLEHYSIGYNLYTDGIKEHFDKILQETPERIVTMKTADQQDFKCILPSVEHKTHRKIEEYRGPSPLDLLKPLIDEREISIFGGSGYWFYDIAHGRFVRQYHDNRDTKETTEYLLGTYRHDQTIEDAKKFDQLHPPKTKINNIEYPYFPVHYRHGTPCDLTGKPRTVTLLYICYEYSRHMVHSITEVSTCNYEISILTNLLCSHPAFDMPTNPEHEIRCYAPPNQPHAKPNLLREIEQNSLSEHYNQYSMASDVSVAPHKSSVFSKLINPEGLIFPQRTGDSAAAGNVDTEQGMNSGGRTISDQLKEIAEIYQKLSSSDSKSSKSNKMAKFQKGFTDEDFQLIEDFWAGKSCFIGGSGYWSYEFCYGSKVTQFHLEGGKRTKEHTLGQYDPESHRAWLRRNREKAFVYEDNYLKQVSNFYGNGKVCEATGEKRSTEVQLRCRMPAQTESPSIVLFSLEEPETCKYVLTLESALLCNGLQSLDKDGLIDPNSADDEFTTTEIITDEEAIKKIIENIKNTKQYLEQLGGGIIIKEITEDVEEIIKTSRKNKKENADDEEADAAEGDQKKKSKN